MTDQDQMIKRKIQFIVAGAMVLFFIMVTVLAFTAANLMNKRAQEKNLTAQLNELQQQINDAQLDIDYFQTEKFIEDYALKYLGWGKEGQKLFDK